ncbi:MAG: hypothetical protein AAGF89_16635, partial [Bacteroidota bacterium]
VDDFRQVLGLRHLQHLLLRPQQLASSRRSRSPGRILLTSQAFTFRAAGQVSDTAKGETSRYDLRRRLLAPLSFEILCIGQFLTSGDYCQDGLQQLSPTEASELLPAVADTLLECDRTYTAVLLKDLYPTAHDVVQILRAAGYYTLPVDPIMKLELDPHWNNIEDYLETVTSKYRVRYRRARGKLAGLRRQRLSVQDVATNQDRIYQLYANVSSGADFNAATLTPDYFPWLAQQGAKVLSHPWLSNSQLASVYAEDGLALSGPVQFHGYFTEGDELVGFTSSVANGSVLHAHYLGLEDDYKYSHHLYHNMLFDLLEEGIEGGFATLDYGRTALEIKSSIGAKPIDYACLLKTRQNWVNKLVPIFTPAVYRAHEWTPRNPFKR